jgi:hypothetical protein
MRVNGSNPAGWRSATFRNNAQIKSGTNIWFGVFCEYYWLPRFDWGTRCFADWWDHLPGIPNTYPITRWSDIYDFRLSMYVIYTSAQNYVRTLTQGVQLSDTRKHTAEYKRNTIQTAMISEKANGLRTIFRFLQSAVSSLDKKLASVSFLRGVQETINASENIERNGDYKRNVTDEAENKTTIFGGFVLMRFVSSSAMATSSVIRGLFLTVLISTRAFVRDYVLSRFLRSRAELVLKSSITREIILESKIG